MFQYFNLGDLELCLGGLRPPKPSVATGLGWNVFSHFFHIFVCSVKNLNISLNTDFNMSLKCCWKWLVI